ncbi:MAG: hypothetical protein QM706_00965 [Nitrospira sp.]
MTVALYLLRGVQAVLCELRDAGLRGWQWRLGKLLLHLQQPLLVGAWFAPDSEGDRDRAVSTLCALHQRRSTLRQSLVGMGNQGELYHRRPQCSGVCLLSAWGFQRKRRQVLIPRADRETGEMVMLHIGENTKKKDVMMRLGLGNNVVARYNQNNNYAFSFLTDQTMG